MNDGWMHYPNDPKDIKRHNKLVLSSISTADLVAEILSRGECVAIEPFPHNEQSTEETCISVSLNDTIGMECYYPARVIVVYGREQE